MTFWQKLKASLDATNNGLSGRKLSGFNIMVQVDCLHLMYYYCLYKERKWAEEIFGEVLIVDFCAVSIFLGLVTVQQIIEFKNGIVKSKTTNTSETVAETATPAPGQQ